MSMLNRFLAVILSLLYAVTKMTAEGFEWNHRFGITTEGVSEFYQEAEENIMTEKIALKFLENQMIQEYRNKCKNGIFSFFLGTHVSEQNLSNCTVDNEHIHVSLTHDTELPFGAYAILKRIRVRHFQTPMEGNCILNGVMPEFYAFMAQMLGWDKLLPLPESTFAKFPMINQGYVYNPDEQTEQMNNCIVLLMKDDSNHNKIRTKCPFRCHTIHSEL